MRDIGRMFINDPNNKSLVSYEHTPVTWASIRSSEPNERRVGGGGGAGNGIVHVYDLLHEDIILKKSH